MYHEIFWRADWVIGYEAGGSNVLQVRYCDSREWLTPGEDHVSWREVMLGLAAALDVEPPILDCYDAVGHYAAVMSMVRKDLLRLRIVDRYADPFIATLAWIERARRSEFNPDSPRAHYLSHLVTSGRIKQ